MWSNYTNPDCSDNLKCRLHCFDEEKTSGVFCTRTIFNLCLLVLQCRLHSKFLKKKNLGYFVAGIYLRRVISYYIIDQSRFFTAEYFVTGIYLNRVISYYLIDQSRFLKGHFDLGYYVAGLFYTC